MEKHEVAAALRAATYSPTKLLTIHAGALAVLSLVLSGISYLLGGLSSEGGIDAMNLHAALMTGRVLLKLAQLVLAPIWTAGLLYAAIGIARGQQVQPRDLTAGFQSVRPLLTSALFIGVQYLSRAFISSFLTSSLVMFTPVGTALYDANVKMETTGETDLAVLLGENYLPVLLTSGVLFALVFVVVSIPVFYRYRMVTYLIMDRQEPGAIRAMFRSRIMMFRRHWQLAKLDLRFWWYYLLLALGGIVSCGHLILPALEINLPVAEWAFLLAGALIGLVVKILAGPTVFVTYAHRYDVYLNEAPLAPRELVKKQVPPEKMPWSY